MAKYDHDAHELLELVGGKDNIAAASHCMTRMRFALKDPSKANVSAIEKLESVKGSFTQAGQFQVIIGNDVADFYKVFVSISGVSEASKEEVKSAALQNTNILQQAMGAIAEVFAPLIPAIITGGLILGFRNVLGEMPYFGPEGNQTLASLSVFWTGVYNFLWLIGEAVFHTGIPVGICWSITKKMGGTPMLGIVLGLTLVSGQLMNAYGVANATDADWLTHSWNFGFVQVRMAGYQAQVIPAILAAITFNYLERFFKKITPSVIQMIVVPFCSLLLAVMAAHFVLGPVGWIIGTWIGNIVLAGITSPFAWIFGLIFGAVYAPLVITGLHHMSNAIDMQLITSSNNYGTPLWPMIALSNIAQGSSVLAMSVLQKHDENAQQVNIPSIISCYLGVTEPAMFGVNLKYGFPFVCAMIGSSIAGGVCTAFGVNALSIGVGGLPGILSIRPEFIGIFGACMLIAIVVPFFLTLTVGKRQGIDKGIGVTDVTLDGEKIVGSDTSTAAAGSAAVVASAATADTSAAVNASAVAATAGLVANGSIKACVNGSALTLAAVNDGVFSAGMMGDGLAIAPSDGTVLAPCDGIVSAMMEETGHAVGLKLPNDLELLIHIGLDTVEMKGEGFSCHVHQGDIVRAGQPLVTFDRDKVAAAGYKDTVLMVVTDPGQATDLAYNTSGNVTANETDVITY